MLKPGKMKEIADEMQKYRIDVIGLQEIRWQGQGRINKKEYTLLYSGPENRTGRYGTGFIISSNIRKSLLLFEPINERICKIRIKGKFRNMTFITAHAPTEDKTELEKEDFYECLDNVLNLCQKYDMVTILGDFNAKNGREDKMKGVVGGYSIHEKRSENGDILVQFAARNNFIIKSTCFPHKRIHLGTCKVPGTNIVNQIDHVLTKKRHSSSVIDVRACRGPNCDSDHYLVRAIIKQKLAKTKVTSKSTRKHWNVGKLNIQENLEKYQRGMERKLFEYQADKNINEKWNDLETIIKEIAEEEISERKKERNSDWCDAECMDAVRNKNKAREIMIARDTRGHRREYKRLRMVANKVWRKKKTEAMQKQLQEIEELNDQTSEGSQLVEGSLGKHLSGDCIAYSVSLTVVQSESGPSDTWE
ncbi:craniofacial development protein 2-like [Ischnura elegans]|uniref:craniofacial development protein 2-like n=1 Tax=Ischnura elegans TaxID=197161 RepID=UPI001ED8763F|nr:craniofacial development protein 2-like [Ischnura elegans]